MPRLNVKIHLQNDDTLCGPACAQMSLNFITGNLPQQSSFPIGAGSSGWLTDPNELRDLLNNALGKLQYQVYAEDTAADALRPAITSIKNRVPAVALVDGGNHWVVLRGFEGGRRPITVHIRNPMPPIDQTRHTHRATDNCADLDFEFTGDIDCDDAVSLRAWERDFFLPCDRAPFAGKFVVIAD